jgi:two-component system sensor histidine kinase RegB
MLTLLFDLAQLSFLLFLTGGLNNPFALLILAPVTISATALTMRSTTILGVLAIVLISLLAYFHVPLTLTTGEVLQLPDLFIVGFWIAIAIGIIFLSAYARRITSESHSMSQALLATQMALAREQKLTDLGGVVAAAAHELGTPLATIKLVSTELAEELEGQPQLAEDAKLISSQADRCRDILRSMGRAGKDDLHMRSAPLGAVVREAAEPHADRGVDIEMDFAAGPGAPVGPPDHLAQARDHPWPPQPRTERGRFRRRLRLDRRYLGGRHHPAGHHGRRPGLSTGHAGAVGRSVSAPSLARVRRQQAGYEGMGLGLFIAKTLLERSGAEVPSSTPPTRSLPPRIWMNAPAPGSR